MSHHVHMWIPSLLIVTSLLGSAINTIALTSEDASPSPDDAIPPITDDETDSPSTEDPDPSLFSTYKEADLDLVGVDKYDDITWTYKDPQANSDGTCYLKGYYDDTSLTTTSSIQSCFDLLSSALNLNVATGSTIYTDTYYYPSASYPYCAVDCTKSSSAFAVSSRSVQMRLVSLASALFAVLALSYF